MRPHVAELARLAGTYTSCASERGPAERVRRLRRAAARHGRAAAARSRASGFVNIVGGCCGTTPDHTRAIAAAVDGLAPRDRSRNARPAALQRPGAVRDRPRHRLRDDRRAHERDRLGALPPADRGGRLPGRGRRRARAGARRRQHPRRQHGRRPARRRAGDDDVPQPARDRARGRADPDHGRQLALLGARGGPQVRAGQGDRQLDQPQGGRGDVPRAGARGSAATAPASS